MGSRQGLVEDMPALTVQRRERLGSVRLDVFTSVQEYRKGWVEKEVGLILLTRSEQRVVDSDGSRFLWQAGG